MLRKQFNVKYIVLVLDDDNVAEVNPKDKPKASVLETMMENKKNKKHFLRAKKACSHV